MLAALGGFVALGSEAQARPRLFAGPAQQPQQQFCRPGMPCYPQQPTQPQGYWHNGRWYWQPQRPAPQQPWTIPLQRPREERVIELPEDGDMWHLTVVVDGGQHSQWVRQQMVAAPRLVELARQTKSHVYAPDYWWVKDNLPGISVPVVMLSTHRGEVVYKASGQAIPQQPEDLADEVESAIQAYQAKVQRQIEETTRPRKALATSSIADCPDCTPRPTPALPNKRPFNNIPDLRPNNSTPSNSSGGFDGAVVALLILAGVAAYLYNRSQQ